MHAFTFKVKSQGKGNPEADARPTAAQLLVVGEQRAGPEAVPLARKCRCRDQYPRSRLY